MSVVRINAISVPAERREVLEKRFAERAGEVSSMPGFEAFELLRPSDDKDVYLVYTRWRSQQDFDNWVASPAFTHGHRAHHSEGRRRHLDQRCLSNRGANRIQRGRSSWYPLRTRHFAVQPSRRQRR